MSTTAAGPNSCPVARRVEACRKQSLWRGVAIFATSFAIFAAGAVMLTFHYQVYEGDALSRTYAAAVVVYDAQPKLANLGFVWPPVPSLLQIPLILYRPLVTGGLAGGIVSALAGALGLVLMDLILARHIANGWVRLSLLLAYSMNVVILYYSINGMSETLLVAVALSSWYSFQRLHDRLPSANGVAYLALMGSLGGLTFLTRYEGASFGAAMFVALLITLKANGRSVAIAPTASTRPSPGGPRHVLAVEAYSLAYLAPFAYAIFLWLFFNWLIMGDPLYFMFGKGSNAQQLSVGLSSDSTLAAMKGDVVASALYALRVSAILSPVFYPAMGLVVLLAIRRHDALATALFIAAVSFPALQGIMHYLGQSWGWTRFYIYVIPFSIISLAYALRQALSGSRLRVAARNAALIGLVAGSSAATNYLIHTLGMADGTVVAFARALARNQAWDNQAYEKDVARYLVTLPADKRVLVDDQQATRIILFTQQFERFVTPHNTGFLDTVRDPVGKVDYLLVPRVDPRLDLILQERPGIHEHGAPFLELEREFPSQAPYWRLYRVVKPEEGAGNDEKAGAGPNPDSRFP